MPSSSCTGDTFSNLNSTAPSTGAGSWSKPEARSSLLGEHQEIPGNDDRDFVRGPNSDIAEVKRLTQTGRRSAAFLDSPQARDSFVLD
jgi:hypothetical protein